MGLEAVLPREPLDILQGLPADSDLLTASELQDERHLHELRRRQVDFQLVRKLTIVRSVQSGCSCFEQYSSAEDVEDGEHILLLCAW